MERIVSKIGNNTTLFSHVLIIREHLTGRQIPPYTRTDHTVPYGTARLGYAVPGSACQATIVQSLRDICR
jgi:hypothetical protein